MKQTFRFVHNHVSVCRQGIPFWARPNSGRSHVGIAIQWRNQNVAGPPDQDPLTLCGRVKARSGLPKAIAKLPDREQQVLMLYYEQDLTLQEVGALTGVGDSRVSQIHTLAVKHLWAVMWETVVNCR